MTNVNRKMKPQFAELLGSGSLIGLGENLCIDAVTPEGRKVYISLTENQAERLATTLERAVALRRVLGRPAATRLPDPPS
jgi:hypothetical protein